MFYLEINLSNTLIKEAYWVLTEKNYKIDFVLSECIYKCTFAFLFCLYIDLNAVSEQKRSLISKT